MLLRYAVAQLVPDLVRQEPFNIGIVLQSEQWVDCKFIERLPRSWDIPEDIEEDVVADLNRAWSQRLQQPSEVVYVPELQTSKEVPHTDRIFLEWLHTTYNRHLRFSEVREAEVEIGERFGFDTFLARLSAQLVVPKPRLRKPTIRSKLRTQLKNEFKQLKLFRDIIREGAPITGTFPWPVDFSYAYRRNGTETEVAIALVDFSQVTFLEKVKDIFAVWTDLRQVRREYVKRLSVVGAVANIDDHQKAVQLLQRVSDGVYLFDSKEHLNQLLEYVRSDLQLPPQDDDTFTRGMFLKALGEVSGKPKELESGKEQS